MNYRMLGKTGLQISEISLGAWQLGGRWGSEFNEAVAVETLNKVIDLGVNFIDTADVYSDGLSEKAVGKVVRTRREKVYVATKCGRRLNPHNAAGYTRDNIRRFVHDSLKNTGLEALDLIQLHCPPTEVYGRQEVFGALDELKKEGKILNYGVSVEKVEEALRAIEYEGVASVQIIFNMFRQKPLAQFFAAAQQKEVGIIARVPLASGLLTGKMNRETHFDQADHRFFNRNGAAFDKGETFSGVDFETGLRAVADLKQLFHTEEQLAQYALRWILMFDAVSCVIPGASNLRQAESNVAAAQLPPLSAAQMDRVREIYDTYIRKDVHHLW